MADIAAAALSITPERQQVLDFTMPFMNQGLTVLTVTRRNDATNLFQAFLPLKIEVWIAILISLVVVATVTTFLSWLSPFDFYSRAVDKFRTSIENEDRINNKLTLQAFKIWKSEREEELEAFSFGHNLWYSLASFLAQGADRTPRSISARFITAIWWLASVILTATYTANLTAFLTVNSLHISKLLKLLIAYKLLSFNHHY